MSFHIKKKKKFAQNDVYLYKMRNLFWTFALYTTHTYIIYYFMFGKTLNGAHNIKTDMGNKFDAGAVPVCTVKVY